MQKNYRCKNPTMVLYLETKTTVGKKPTLPLYSQTTAGKKSILALYKKPQYWRCIHKQKTTADKRF